MIFEPENFRRGEAGQDGVAQGFDGRFRPAELLGDLIAFGGGGGVAPKFGGTDDFALVIQRHKAVLLAADADGFDFGGRQLWPARKAWRMALAVASRQVCGMLLLRAGREIGDQIVGLRGGGQDLAVLRIHDQHLGGLRAAIDAD